MKFTYYIIKEKKLVLERIEGHTSLEGIQKGMMQIWQHPDYDTNFSGLLDLRNADVTMGHAEVDVLAKLLFSSVKASNGNMILLVSKPMETALSMIFQEKMISKNKVLIYNYPATALSILGVSNEEFDMLDSDRCYSFYLNEENTEREK